MTRCRGPANDVLPIRFHDSGIGIPDKPDNLNVSSTAFVSRWSLLGGD
jgi:hypothetical protein